MENQDFEKAHRTSEPGILYPDERSVDDVDLEGILFSISGEGFADDECGSTDAGGWYGLLRGPFTGAQLRRFDHDDELEGLSDLQVGELADGLGAGVILSCDSQGFKDWESFETEEELDARWSQPEEATKEPSDDEGSDEQ